MKTTISILLTAFFGLFLSTQNVNAQGCIICNSNTVGDSSSAIGAGNISTGLYSLATGFQCEALGNSAQSVGYKAKAYGDYSISIGAGAKSLEYRSIAIGTTAISENQDSYTFGINVKSSADYSFTFGVGPQGYQFLENTTENSIIFGMGSLYPTLFIGNAAGVEKTGKIGIGNVTSPQAKLHIRADNNEDASIKLEPTHSSHYAKIFFSDDFQIFHKSYNPLIFKSYNSKGFIFKNGNVGIGIDEPDARLQVNGDIFIDDQFSGLILKSPDGQCWKGTIDNDGSFNFESVDCSLFTGNDNSQRVSQNVARIYPNPAGSKLFVEIPDGMQQSYVSIYNEQGVLLQSSDVQAGSNSISLKKMPAGVLIVKVYSVSGELLSTEKVMHR